MFSVVRHYRYYLANTDIS